MLFNVKLHWITFTFKMKLNKETKALAWIFSLVGHCMLHKSLQSLLFEDFIDIQLLNMTMIKAIQTKTLIYFN